MSFTGRIGLLVPSSNTTVETEFHRALPAGVTLHVGRLFIAQVTTDSIEKMVSTLEAQSRLLASADVTNWKSLDIIDRLERDIGKPVLSTTLVSVWGALNRIGYTGSIPGCGRLLREIKPLTKQKHVA